MTFSPMPLALGEEKDVTSTDFLSYTLRLGGCWSFVGLLGED